MPVVNAILELLTGDMALLPLVNNWHMLMLEAGQDVLLSSEDMRCAFYLFEFPELWLPWLCFSMAVSRRNLGIPGDPKELVYVCLTVVPMGWNSATGVIQHAHRSLCKMAGMPSACEIRRTAL